ncbi:MAG: aminodeoxychorismate/anthranilate synthase component II [Lachnospiraceae bacterium]|nr:aminodeoxychorismate/anthranilate synthase component II [Lachnospiraceae bacterium]
MNLLIDNYDSFSYNLVQYIGEIDPEIRVIRNDEMSVEEIRELHPAHIILSPGPGRPENAGVIIDAVRSLGESIPILGVCLGHQAICMAFGGVVTYASRLMHGKQSIAILDTGAPIFAGCSERTPVARYHSLAASRETLPAELKVIAETEEQEIMAVMHRQHSIYGVQFHPESILTPEGKTMLRNFLAI